MSSIPLLGAGTTSPAAILTDAYGVSGLAFWHKVNELTGYTNGQSVTTLPDASGNGRDFIAYGVGPTYSTNMINSLPTLAFTTGLQMHLASTSLLNGEDAWSIFVVVTSNSAGDILTKMDETPNKGYRLGEVNGRYLELTSSSGNYALIDHGALTSPSVMGGSKPSGTSVSATMKSFKDGVITTGSTGSAGTIASLNNTLPVVIGGFPVPTAAAAFNGSIGEIVAYTRQVTDGEANTIMAALNTKWVLF